MTFDIHQLDNLDYDEAEPILDAYQDGIIEEFANSPEGQVYLETHPEIGGWIAHLIYYGYCYESFTLPKMTKSNIQLVIEELFPRKISLLSPEDAEDAIPELLAFWQFLKRQYKPRHADAIIKYLEKIQPSFGDIMNDSSKFGMAKSFFMMGEQSGFDMTTQEGLTAFQQQYNASLRDTQANPNPNINLLKEKFSNVLSPSTQSTQSKQAGARAKKKRTIAKLSRKANRKKK
jgi:hypothetical protein